ncbi:MAG: hypothetical protein DMF24_02555 [Verrucomicrobia bacterium]|nr:MAG: hypothetical protein DMF24_02555 [Verrucomicrobiota bacterium]
MGTTINKPHRWSWKVFKTPGVEQGHNHSRSQVPQLGDISRFLFRTSGFAGSRGNTLKTLRPLWPASPPAGHP